MTGIDGDGTNPKDLIGAKKAPLSLVPPALVIGAAEAMANGADKYGPYNWREYSVQYMTYLEAMLRHINALIDREDRASDTGIHHLKHVVAGGGILLDAIEAGTVIDNRPPAGPGPRMMSDQDKTAPKRYADDVPYEDRVPAPEAKLPWVEAEHGAIARDAVEGDAVFGGEPLIGTAEEERAKNVRPATQDELDGRYETYWGGFKDA